MKQIFIFLRKQNSVKASFSSKENRLYQISIIFILITALTAVFYNIFQDEQAYRLILSKITSNYDKVDGQVVYEKVPYQEFSEEKLLHWDSEIYYELKTSLYRDIWEGYYAFFPFFPVVWNLTDMQASHFFIFHQLLYFLALLFFLNAIFRSVPIKESILMLCMPMAVMFYLPYTESYFMLFSSVAVWGLIKKKPAVYFVAMFFASTCRPVGTILILAVLCAEVYWLLGHRNIKYAATHFLKMTFPILSGTFAAMIFEYIQGAEHLFTFIEVQKYWEHVFSLPDSISDWSAEQEGANKYLFYVLMPVLLYTIVKTAIPMLQKKRQYTKQKPDAKSFLFILSVAYIFGILLFSLFFQKGNLHGSARYIMCTPFFWIAAFQLPQKLQLALRKNEGNILKICIVFLPLIYLILYKQLKFNGFGFYSLHFIMLTIFFRKHIGFIPFAVYIVLSALWISYLFNCQLAGGWMFI